MTRSGIALPFSDVILNLAIVGLGFAGVHFSSIEQQAAETTRRAEQLAQALRSRDDESARSRAEAAALELALSRARSATSVVEARVDELEKLDRASQERILALSSESASRLLEWHRARDRGLELERSLERVGAELVDWRNKYQVATALASKFPAVDQAVVRSLLAGFKMPPRRTVFVVDISTSMAADGRWETVLDTISQYVELLELEAAALVVFRDRGFAFPSDFHMLDMRDPPKRDELLAALGRVKPGGSTNHLAGFEVARGFADADTWIVFTDGQTTSTDGTKVDADLARRAVDLVKTSGPKNLLVVGLGRLYDGQLREFCRALVDAVPNAGFVGR